MKFSQIRTFFILAFLCIGLSVPAVAADTFGRVIGYDAADKKVTFIEDSLGWSNPKRPDFTVLPPKVVTLAEDPGDMAPRAGGRLRVDLEKKELTIFNASTQQIETFAMEIISNEAGVEPDSALLSGKTFPIVDKAKAEITVYSKRQKTLSVLKVPAQYMALDDATWTDGHNIQVNIGADGKATSFVNLSKASK